MPDVAPLGDVGGCPSIDALQNALKEHSENFIKPDIEDPFLMEVRRGFVLSDALELIRVSQDDLHNPLKISFSGEDGVDLGGLRREFWSLFLHNISHSVYVKGKPGRLTFQANFVAKKKKTYFHIGQLTALSIIQDGPGLPIFSDIVTDYILNGKSLLLNLEDLQDRLKDVLLKMQDCTSEAEIRNLYSSIFDEATDAGFIIPVSRFNKQHVRLLQAALIENQISTCQDELDQFIKGLELHQVLGLLRQDSYIASSRVLLSGRIKPVTVATLRKLLKFKFTTGNQEKDQKATKQGFLTFLQATKGTATVVNGIKVETKDVLMWLSGSSVIPAIGFHKPIDIDFGESTFVNTCALALTLKVQPELSDAVTYYTELIINSQTFGKE